MRDRHPQPFRTQREFDNYLAHHPHDEQRYGRPMIDGDWIEEEFVALDATSTPPALRRRKRTSSAADLGKLHVPLQPASTESGTYSMPVTHVRSPQAKVQLKAWRYGRVAHESGVMNVSPSQPNQRLSTAAHTSAVWQVHGTVHPASPRHCCPAGHSAVDAHVCIGHARCVQMATTAVEHEQVLHPSPAGHAWPTRQGAPVGSRQKPGATSNGAASPDGTTSAGTTQALQPARAARASEAWARPAIMTFPSSGDGSMARRGAVDRWSQGSSHTRIRFARARPASRLLRQDQRRVNVYAEHVMAEPHRTSGLQRVLWVIQSNALNPTQLASANKLMEFLDLQGTPHTAIEVGAGRDSPIEVMPWRGPVIFYGSAKLVERVVEINGWTPGVYYDEVRFSFDAVRAGYNELLLNADSKVMALGELLAAHGAPETEWFIRPVSNMKVFAGGVRKIRDLPELLERGSKSIATAATRVQIAEPKTLRREWRTVVVDGRVITGSMYRSHGQAMAGDAYGTINDDVIAFATAAAKRYQPAPVFVLDVGEWIQGSERRLSVVECNPFNCSGWYWSDFHAIAREVTAFVSQA